LKKKPSSPGYVLRPMFRTGTQVSRSLFLGKPNTILYPYQKLDLPPTYRGKHTLDFKRCIGCGNCVQICPNNCMWLEKLEDPELGKIERPGVDLGRCLFCGLCVEVCPTVALHETVEFELADRERSKLIFGPLELRDDKYADGVVEERQKRKLPFLDMSKCTSCEKCAGICPVTCITMTMLEGVGRAKPEIDLSKCTSCEKCAAVCPEKALVMTDVYESYFEMPQPKILVSSCTGCGACMKACPADVVYMLEMPGTEKTLKDGKKGKPKKRAVFVLEKCVGCGRCFRACRFNAIEMPGVRK